MEGRFFLYHGKPSYFNLRWLMMEIYEIKRMPRSFMGNHYSCFLIEFLFLTTLLAILDNLKIKPSFAYLWGNNNNDYKVIIPLFEQITCGWTVCLCCGTPTTSRLLSLQNLIVRLSIWNYKSPQISLVLPWQLYRAPQKSWGRQLSFPKPWASLQNENSHPETSATTATSLQFWDRKWKDRIWFLRPFVLRNPVWCLQQD